NVCRNSVRIFRKPLEEKLLNGLQAQVLEPEVVEYTLAKFEEELLRAVDDLDGELEQMRRRKAELDREIANLANFVARGDVSPGVRAALVERERELNDITAKLLESRPDSVRARLRAIRATVERDMRSLQSVLAGDAQTVRTELMRHIERITMTPEGDHYIASGEWNL